MPAMNPQMTTVSRGSGAWLARLVSGAVLLLAGIIAVAYLAARFVLWPNIDAVATRYAGTVEERLGAPLTWKSIRTDWSGLRPSIEISGPVLGDGEQAVRAERLFATISLRALLRGQADFHDLVLDSPVVPLVRSGDSLSLAALPAATDRPKASSGLAQWLLQQPDVRIGGGTILVSDPDDPRRNLRFDQVALVLRNHGRDHDARLDIGDANALAASLVVQAELTGKTAADPVDWRAWSGNVQWEARQLSLQPLLAQLPAAVRAVLNGRLAGVVADSLAGRVDPWVSLQLDEGKLRDMRMRLRSDDVALMVADTMQAGTTAAPGRSGNSGGQADKAAGAGALRFTRINAELRARQNADGATEVSAPTLELTEVGGASIRATSPTPVVTLARDDGRIERMAGGFERIDIDPALNLAKLLAGASGDSSGASGGASAAATLQRLSGAGQITDVKVSWQRGAGDAPAPWSARGAFERASLDVAPTEHQVKFPWALRVPDIQNLSGSFDANQNGGKATLRTPVAAPNPAGGQAKPAPLEPSQVRFGGALVEPEVPFSSLDSQFSWKVDRAAGPAWLAVTVDRFNFSNADGKGAVTGRYQTGGRGSGVADFRARIDHFQAKRVWRYLPHEVPEGIRSWIKQAFEAGTLEGAEARWQGDIKDFPYRLKTQDGPGEFRFAGRTRDLLLKYEPDWPAIHGINGEVVFERAGMKFQAERATILEVPLTGVTARIDDLAVGRLEVEGRAQGDAAQLLKFVNTSSLADTIGGVTRPMVAKGPATLDVSLRLPLKDLSASTARGRVELAGAAIEYEPAEVRLDDVHGRLEFTEKTLAINGLAARFNGAPIELSGQTTGPGSMRLLAGGTMTADGLRRFSGNPLTRQLRGATTYKADIDISRDGTRLTIESDLAGLASDLPSPMAKAADAHWPLKVTVSPIPVSATVMPAGEQRAGASADRIEASLQGEILLSAERARNDARKPMQVTRAALAVNRQPAMPDQGVTFQFTGQRIDLDAWMAVFSSGGGTDGGAGGAGIFGNEAASLPLTVSLLADEVRVADRNLNKVVLGASRAGSQWLANLSAREVNGFLTWSGTAASGKLTARLGRLEIPKSQQQELAASLATGPSTLPAMDIFAEKFILGGVDFGALELVARNIAQAPAAQSAAARSSGARGTPRPRVWQLERLRLFNPAAELDAKGQWDRTTSLSYRVNIVDAGEFLNRLELKNVVKGGKGFLSGELHWSGSPFSMDLPTLGGTMEIAVRDGQFLKVEPGAAKLIGVLNLQALPKLLTLDFKDIFAQGFSFDELRGTVGIERGIATTDSLAMRGLQAVVQIKGQADLKASTQDLKVVVIPELNGGLATLAYAAIVNPAIGLGAFLAQSLFSQPLSKALAHEIDVTGSWADPTVVERKRERFGAPEGQ